MSTQRKIDWSKCDDVESVPGSVSGAWVIKGTRVQAQAIVDNARAGCTAEEIATEIFPSLPLERVKARAAFRQDQFALERMRILLDENTPSGLRRILAGHDVRTAPEMGWAGYSNGQLLDEAEKAGFDALITGDRTCRFSRTSPAEISPSSFSPPIRGP